MVSGMLVIIKGAIMKRCPSPVGTLLRVIDPRTVSVIHRFPQTPPAVGLKAVILSFKPTLSHSAKSTWTQIASTSNSIPSENLSISYQANLLASLRCWGLHACLSQPFRIGKTSSFPKIPETEPHPKPSSKRVENASLATLFCHL